MIDVRYIVPVVFGTEYFLYTFDIKAGLRPTISDVVDFNDGENIFSTSVQAVRIQVLQGRFDVYCKQRIYRRDEVEIYNLEVSMLKKWGFTTLDQEEFT